MKNQNNEWEIEKLNLVKEISKAMSYDYSEYDAMSNNDTPEEVAVNLLDDFITKTLQQQREEIMEWLEDNDYLSNEGRLFKTQFWKLFIRQTK